MLAKEMFEKLGYKQEIIDEQLIYSAKDLQANIEYQIIFYLDDRSFEAITDNFIHANNINMKELQAINKQCEELGWK